MEELDRLKREEVPCPQCDRLCPREDIYNWGWCLRCEEIQDEVITWKYKGDENELGY